MSDAETSTEKGPFGSIALFVIGGFLALLALVYATVLLKETPQGPIQELPHATVMVEFASLDQQATRAGLVKLQEDLQAIGLATLGPKDFPFLVPGGDLPATKSVAGISDEEFALAKPWLHAGGWLVPRIYSPDLTSAVIRLAPPDRGSFPSGTATRVKEVIKKHAALGTIHVYSRALGLEEEEDRAKINVAFGVQTASVRLLSTAEGDLWNEAHLKQIHGAIPENPRVRSATTFISFALYTAGVALRIDNPNLEQIDWGMARTVSKLGASTGLVSNNGKMAWVEVTTDAEGEANYQTCVAVASALPALGSIKADVPRKRGK